MENNNQQVCKITTDSSGLRCTIALAMQPKTFQIFVNIPEAVSLLPQQPSACALPNLCCDVEQEIKELMLYCSR